MTYWLQQPLTVNVDGPAGKTSTSFARPFVRIGSDPDSDVILESGGLARRAVYVHATPAGVFAVRLQNPRRRVAVLTGEWLADGEPLQVGPYHVTVSLSDGHDQETPAISLLHETDRSSLRSHFEVFCRDKLAGLKSFAAGLILIGRAPQCSLQLKGQNVSKFHCVLYRELDRLWCIDLLSSNGTLVRGTPIVAEELLPADVLDVGEFSLVYRGCQPNKASELTPKVAACASAPPVVVTVTEATPCQTAIAASAIEASNSLATIVETELSTVRALNEQNHLLRGELQAALEELTLQRDELRLERERLAVERQAFEAERQKFEMGAISNAAQTHSITQNVPIKESTSTELLNVPIQMPTELVGLPMPAENLVVREQSRPDPEVVLLKKKERDDLATLVLDRLEEPWLARRRVLMLWASVSFTLITAVALGWLIYLKMVAKSEV